MAISPSQPPARVVLIACGSFNPVTNMHLRMFELARDALNKTGKYNVIAGIMSPVSDHYPKKGLLCAKHRCEMVRLGLKSSDWVRLDTWESEQKMWTETVCVLDHHYSQLHTTDSNANVSLKNVYESEEKTNFDVVDSNRLSLPNFCDISSNVHLKLLCGADLLESFSKPGLWKEADIEKIVGKYGIVCITRDDSDPRKFIYESDLLSKYQENITIVTEWIRNDVSSTKIRRALRRGESVKYLLQDSVINYIKKHQLYDIMPDNQYITQSSASFSSDVSKNTEEVKVVFVPSSKYLNTAESPPQSPKRQREIDDDEFVMHSPKRMTCMADIGSLMRRMRNVRVAFAPETCV